MRRHLVVAGYVGWMLALTAAFYAFPSGHLVLWSAISLTSAGAIVVGVLTHRPAHPAGWWLLALAVTLFGAGDTTYNVLATMFGEVNPFPSVADVFYLAMYPVMAAGLVLLIKARTAGRDRGSVLDALSITTALALLSWIFLIDPYVRDAGLTWIERGTSIAYPLGDVLIVATLVRLLITAGRNRAGALLAVGTVALLVSDVGYGLDQLDGSYSDGNVYDLGWALFYLAWGAAALRPSMVDLTVPAPGPSGEMSIRRIALLMGVSLVAPATLLVTTLDGKVRYGPMIAVSSAVLFLLVLARLAGVVTRHRQAVERERILRSAGDDLVSAADADGVVAAVHAAVGRLLPGAHRAALHADGPTAGVPRSDPDAPPRASRLLPVVALEGSAARPADGFATALVCPLAPGAEPSAGRCTGLLRGAAEESELLTLRVALEILASQAALAIERVTLSQEVTRRNNEAYFRTLVQNAHDVILIVDDDGRVRYASPSAATMLGPGSVVGTPVLDLVAPEDRAAAERALLAAWDGRAGSGTRGYRILRTDGGSLAVEWTSRDLRGDPTVDGVVLTLRDVTEQLKLENELTRRAFHDALTGLPNRVRFRERVERALATADDTLVGLLLVDLDDFKLVNDTMGHGAGADHLIIVATRQVSRLRPRATAAPADPRPSTISSTSSPAARSINSVSTSSW